jgi:hypothetical protein
MVPKDEPIIPKRCVFITLDGLGKRLALTASNNDKYHPRKTGLYDVGVSNWEGTHSKDVNQKWWYDAGDHSLHCYGHDDTDAILFEGYNRNLVLYRNLKRDSQKFTYNGSTKFWRNDHTKRAMSIEWDHFKDGENVVTKNVDDNHNSSGVNWDIHYCDDQPTAISSGGGASS